MSIYRTVKRAPISDVHVEGEPARTVPNGSATRYSVNPVIAIDYSGRRKARPATILLTTTSEWLATLPSHVQPRELARQFPRIANSLCAMWKDTETCKKYVEELLTDRRNGRRGFAVEIVRELDGLRAYRETIFPASDDDPEQVGLVSLVRRAGF
jgi:hypothetical protein